jgi:phage-related tail protein
MFIKRSHILFLAVAAMFVAVSICGLLTNGFGFVATNAVDFAAEQQPAAKSAGDYIGKQYSQLRQLSVALDTTSCKIQANEAAQKTLKETYASEPDPLKWPEDARNEFSNLRWEHTTLLQSYAQVAGQYNNLRTDIRTVVDNMGLQVQDIPQAEALSPIPGMCNGFALPELK